VPVPQPVWTLSGPDTVAVGRPFDVTATVRLPQGWYQDADSEFLKLEPTPPARVTARSSSAAVERAGKKSYTGTFTLTRTVVLDAPVTSVVFTTGWQICQVDGVCLLPVETRITLNVSPSSSPQAPFSDVWAALLAAFAGGLLLNLMPCVFPVLALKAVGLASAGTELRRRRREAVLFASGGWGTLVVLGAVTSVVAAAGQRLDWGFTFQQPLFVWAMTLAFWVFTLQLWGVWKWNGSPFSLSLSASAPSAWRSLAGGAFLVLTAAPCTAPLLGPAIGFAFTQPPVFIPLFFAAAGLGLVAPLLVLQFWPAWTRWLPKPGAWMVSFERISGFVLAATVLYLVWVLTRQTSADAVWPALAALGAVAAALAGAERWKRFVALRWIGLAVVLVAFAAGVFWTQTPSPTLSTADKPGWERYESGLVERQLAEGKTVFVDATAAWCATCQVNEAAVLDRTETTALFDRLDIVRVRADYTRPDTAIRDWLASVDRAGLPVYALYRPGKPVYLLGELLGPGFNDEIQRLVAPPLVK
jgi:thiol:disulfide interchange protein DsbD